jgi:hypothetical protein
MPEKVPCRRCSECRGSEHHWLDNMDFEGPEDPEYVCKHCPAVGIECSACEEGIRNGKRCGVCQGEGILQCGTEETESHLLGNVN